MAKPTKAIAIERMQRALDAIPALRESPYSPEFGKWQRETEAAIAYTFVEDTRNIRRFESVRYSIQRQTSHGNRVIKTQKAYLGGLAKVSVILKSMLDEIEEYWEDEDQLATPFQTPRVAIPLDPKQVFVVHGRDHGTMNTVARFLEVLELEPIILQEQPNRGLTVIEKFEQHAQVGFAVVLFTPDDVGALRDVEEEPSFRARQNVIFELGYLIRHLGRGRVAVLYKGDEGDIEIPSDYSGILYTSLDGGDGWKMELIREMKSAGLAVDANRAF